eukprot:922040_1
MSVCQQTSITMLILLLSLHFAAISALFMAAGWYHNCVLERNVTKCFGRNNYGQLGQGDTNQRGDEPNEMGDNLPEIDLGSNFKPTHVILGYWHTCVVGEGISATNTAKCFGRNNYGQLGYGDTMNRGN